MREGKGDSGSNINSRRTVSNTSLGFAPSYLRRVRSDSRPLDVRSEHLVDRQATLRAALAQASFDAGAVLYAHFKSKHVSCGLNKPNVSSCNSTTHPPPVAPSFGQGLIIAIVMPDIWQCMPLSVAFGGWPLAAGLWQAGGPKAFRALEFAAIICFVRVRSRWRTMPRPDDHCQRIS